MLTKKYKFNITVIRNDIRSWEMRLGHKNFNIFVWSNLTPHPMLPQMTEPQYIGHTFISFYELFHFYNIIWGKITRLNDQPSTKAVILLLYILSLCHILMYAKHAIICTNTHVSTTSIGFPKTPRSTSPVLHPNKLLTCEWKVQNRSNIKRKKKKEAKSLLKLERHEI